jgi:hypothetical protein
VRGPTGTVRADLTPFALQLGRNANVFYGWATDLANPNVEHALVTVGLGRIAALYGRSSTSHPVR